MGIGSSIRRKGNSMIEVDKKIFFDTVGPQDVHPHIINEYKYPYSSNWKLRNGKIIGKTVDYHPGGHKGRIATKYFLFSP